MRIHGMYCGPNWSAGTQQPSVRSTVLPIDDFDATCQDHDMAYADGSDTAAADIQFALNNLSQFDVTRNIAGIVVGAQGAFKSFLPTMPTENSQLRGTNVRGRKRSKTEGAVNALPRNPQRPPAPTKRKIVPLAQLTAAPVAIGTTLYGAKPRTSVSTDSVRVQAQDLLSAVDGPVSSTTPELGVMWPLNPCYLASGSLSMYTPYYDEYKLHSVEFTFHTKMPTSTNGEIFMAVTSNPTNNLYDTSNSNFVAKFMTTPNAIMGPIWQSHKMIYRPDQAIFKKVNPLTDASMIDSTYGDFVIYVQSTSLGSTIGYVVIKYDITFRKKRFTSAMTMLSELNPTLYVSVSEVGTLGAHVVNNPVELIVNNSSFAAAGANKYGAVFEAIYDSGIAFPSTWASRILSGATTDLTVLPGQKFYLTIYSNYLGNYTARVYTNYSSAVAAGNDWLVWNDTGSVYIDMSFQISQVFASVTRTLSAV